MSQLHGNIAVYLCIAIIEDVISSGVCLDDIGQIDAEAVLVLVSFLRIANQIDGNILVIWLGF